MTQDSRKESKSRKYDTGTRPGKVGLVFSSWGHLLAIIAVLSLLGLSALLLFLLLLLLALALGLLLGGLAIVALALLLVIVGIGLGLGVGGLGLLGGRGGGLGRGSGSGLLLGAVKRGVVVLVLGLPLGGGGLVGAAVLVELAGGLELLLLQGDGAQTPAARVQVTLHDAALDLGDDTVVAGGELDGGHLSDTNGDSLTLGGHEDDLLVDLNAGLCR